MPARVCLYILVQQQYDRTSEPASQAALLPELLVYNSLHVIQLITLKRHGAAACHDNVRCTDLIFSYDVLVHINKPPPILR